jgi:HK97 family phage portal protein
MSKKKKKKRSAELEEKRSAAKNAIGTIGFLITDDDGDDLKCPGYTSLADNPEIFGGCRKIASLISSMPIMLMENGDSGDTRIFNELSRKIDIEPNKYMTRRTWMEAIVMNLLLYGRGNSVVRVKTRRGFLENLEPIPASRVCISNVQYSRDYTIMIDGQTYRPDDVLHFVDNPDKNYPYKGKGITVVLRDVANNLKQASYTKKGFMSSKYKPSVIVKVDSMIDEFSSPEGRKQLAEKYVENTEAGEPWIIPAEQFEVETIKPLSLADLAISDSVEIDKRTVAAILGVPPFVLGVGEYNQTAWNSFVTNTVRIIAEEIEQELTKKLITNPKWYLKFNILSLMNWDIKTIADVFGSLSDRGFVDGNEVRGRIGMSPREGLSELRVLENYIGWEYSNKQKKLIQEGE